MADGARENVNMSLHNTYFVKQDVLLYGVADSAFAHCLDEVMFDREKCREVLEVFLCALRGDLEVYVLVHVMMIEC